MRFRDLVRDINRHEQKLENVLLYVDFMDHDLPVILLKDGSLLTLFQLADLDYENLSEDEKKQFSHYARVALEQLPDEGAGFMLSNLLIRDTPPGHGTSQEPGGSFADSVPPGQKARLLGRPGHQELRQPDSVWVALF